MAHQLHMYLFAEALHTQFNGASPGTGIVNEGCSFFAVAFGILTVIIAVCTPAFFAAFFAFLAIYLLLC
jgi:hypothetical protein